jgi:hypothetical protein
MMQAKWEGFMRSFLFSAAVMFLVTGPSFAKADKAPKAVLFAKEAACRVTTMYWRSNGDVSFHVCIRPARSICNAVPPEGICAGYWGVGIANKTCQAIPHC